LSARIARRRMPSYSPHSTVPSWGGGASRQARHGALSLSAGVPQRGQQDSARGASRLRQPAHRPRSSPARTRPQTAHNAGRRTLRVAAAAARRSTRTQAS
jgi:hypothetical protein